MGLENHKTVVRSSILALITLCYLLPKELAYGRTFAAKRQSLELAKHKGTIKSIEVCKKSLSFFLKEEIFLEF